MDNSQRALSQNALNIFEGEWATALPLPEGAGLIAGTALLAADPRLQWALAELGGVAGQRVLELGPLEGGHSYMLDRAGAREVLAIEGLERAYLRCLVFKSILQIESVRFMYADFIKYLRTTDDAFDMVIASGVLYHQLDPMQLLADVARVSPRVYVWTHYYDADLIAAQSALTGRFGALEMSAFKGHAYRRVEHRYPETTLDSARFCGGRSDRSYWLPREDILTAVRSFGYRDIVIGVEEPNHQNGPAFGFIARR